MRHRVLIVTGEPRSGTSLTMALLDRMVVPIACDPDKRGSSYETSGTGVPGMLPVSKIRAAHGSAIKLLCVPAQKRLRDFGPGIVFCTRTASEQVASQIKFFQAALDVSLPGRTDLLEQFVDAQNRSMPDAFVRAVGRHVLTMPFEDTIERPREACERLAAFAGVDPGEAWRHVRIRDPACAIDLSIELSLMHAACRAKSAN